MNELLNEEKCTGCTACYSICPKSAIEMKMNLEGFKFPIINKDKCIGCGLCEKVCPVGKKKNQNYEKKYYAAYNLDKSDIENSSSGGIFKLLAERILNENGVVYGARFIDNMNLTHSNVQDKRDIELLMGSKYLQSDLGDTFSEIKKHIINKRKVLFVGTPCQVAGLKEYLKVEYDNLYCVDLICHGVPTKLLFEKYITENENEYGKKMTNLLFRDKENGWEDYSLCKVFEDGTVERESAKSSRYMGLFISDICLRKSCYNCSFKISNKFSDITLGDFWGISKESSIYNKKGVSAVIVNSENGNIIFNSIKENIKYSEVDKHEIIKGNPALLYSPIMPRTRKHFFDDINNMQMEHLFEKYKMKWDLLSKIRRKITQIKILVL